MLGNGCWVLLMILSLSFIDAQECFVSSFHRRYGFDDLTFPDFILLLTEPGENRADCVSKCKWTPLCNQASFNDVINTCRLYSGSVSSSADGNSETGWQNYGASCDIYRLNNSISSSDVVNDHPDNICDVGYHAVLLCKPTSCYSEGSWEDVAVKCTSTLFQYSKLALDPTTTHTVLLTFDLEPSHVISVHVSGSPSYNEVELQDGSGNLVMLLSLRFHVPAPYAVFNTKTGGSFGTEERQFYLYNFIADDTDYNLDIHIMDAQFKSYGNGNLLLTNQMRLPLTGVRKVNFRGIADIHTFKVGPYICTD